MLLCPQRLSHHRASSCSYLCKEWIGERTRKDGTLPNLATRPWTIFLELMSQPLSRGVRGRATWSGLSYREMTLSEHSLSAQRYTRMCLCYGSVENTKGQQGSRINASEPPSQVLFNQRGAQLLLFPLRPWPCWVVCFDRCITQVLSFLFFFLF